MKLVHLVEITFYNGFNYIRLNNNKKIYNYCKNFVKIDFDL